MAAAMPLIKAQLASVNRSVIELPLTALVPDVTDSDVDTAVQRASQLIDSNVVLTSEGDKGTIVFTSAGLATALRSEEHTSELQSH